MTPFFSLVLSIVPFSLPISLNIALTISFSFPLPSVPTQPLSLTYPPFHPFLAQVTHLPTLLPLPFPLSLTYPSFHPFPAPVTYFPLLPHLLCPYHSLSFSPPVGVGRCEAHLGHPVPEVGHRGSSDQLLVLSGVKGVYGTRAVQHTDYWVTTRPTLRVCLGPARNRQLEKQANKTIGTKGVSHERVKIMFHGVYTFSDRWIVLVFIFNACLCNSMYSLNKC